VFGTYRYVLALLVVFAHLSPVSGRPTRIGIYAVWAFFVLSGYLMTSVLHRTYGFSVRGVARYLANRALRIYPPYWTVALLAAWSAWLLTPVPLPTGPNAFKFLVLPPTADNLVRQVVLFGLTMSVWPRLVWPAWSLHLELCFYVLMGLGLARGRAVAVWLPVSIAIATNLLLDHAKLDARYATLAAASLPFSAGAATFFVSRRVPALSPALVPVTVLAFAAHALGAGSLWGDTDVVGYYASFVIAVAATLLLGRVDAHEAQGIFRRADRFLGDLSYPIFLVHMPTAQTIASCVGPHGAITGWIFTFSCLPAIHVAAYAVHRAVAAPVERLRGRVRERRIEPWVPTPADAPAGQRSKPVGVMQRPS